MNSRLYTPILNSLTAHVLRSVIACSTARPFVVLMFTSKCVQCHKWCSVTNDRKTCRCDWSHTFSLAGSITSVVLSIIRDVASTWWWEWEGSASITTCSYCCAAIITLMQTVLDLTLSSSQKELILKLGPCMSSTRKHMEKWAVTKVVKVT